MSSESASNMRPMPGSGTGISGGGAQGMDASPSGPADLGGVPFPLPDVVLEPFVRQALAEDLGRRGDITSAAVIPPSATACFDVTSREPGVHKDVPPYFMAAGYRAEPAGLNSEGMRRNGFSAEQIANVKHAYKEIYLRDLPLEEAKANIDKLAETQPELLVLRDFLNTSKRGIVR